MGWVDCSNKQYQMGKWIDVASGPTSLVLFYNRPRYHHIRWNINEIEGEVCYSVEDTGAPWIPIPNASVRHSNRSH